MKKELEIADGISLPTEVVTQTVAIIAKRRAGKSYTMRRIVEQIFKKNEQVILVDPKGDQWGIRSSADGKKAGLPVVILGGERGDAPLEVGSGEVVANLVVKERVSVVLDLSHFRKYEVATFMTAFMENLYRLKAQEAYRTTCMLVIDEADAIAPQKPQKGEERMLGAADDIVRRGGQRGIGCTLVTQRSAVLNKNVLTQAQMLVVLRTIAPQDLAAIKAWIEVHGDLEQGREMMESLPSLPTGDAWFWSPGWPTEKGIFKRAHVFPIETFDSGATPKPGEKKITPKSLADVDLEGLKRQMAEIMEKAENDNPVVLKKKIKELEGALKGVNPLTVTSKVEIDRIVKETEKRMTEQFMLERDEWLRQIENWFKIIGTIGEAANEAMAEYKRVRLDISVKGAKSRVSITGVAPFSPKFSHKSIKAATDIMVNQPVTGNDITTGLSGPEQKILNAIAWFESIGIEEPEQVAVASIAGYTYGGGGFNNPRGSLRTKGFVEYKGSKITLTESGKYMAGDPEDAPTTDELHQKVLSILSGPEQKLLTPLLEAHPNGLTNEELAERSGYKLGSGGYNNPRGSLRTKGLIEYLPGGLVRARDLLFID